MTCHKICIYVVCLIVLANPNRGDDRNKLVTYEALYYPAVNRDNLTYHTKIYYFRRVVRFSPFLIRIGDKLKLSGSYEMAVFT